MGISLLSIIFLAIVLLVVIYLTRKHWRIYCVLGGIVLGALVAWGCITAHYEKMDRLDKIINRLDILIMRQK